MNIFDVLKKRNEKQVQRERETINRKSSLMSMLVLE
jgi:hypothetical protein